MRDNKIEIPFKLALVLPGIAWYCAFVRRVHNEIAYFPQFPDISTSTAGLESQDFRR